MRSSILVGVLLVGASVFALTVEAQVNAAPGNRQSLSTDVGVTFSLERADVVPTQCCFWLKGGGADAAVTLWKGLGVAATVTGDEYTNYAPGYNSTYPPGYNVSKIAVLAGPRYTRTLWANSVPGGLRSRLQVYGDGLLGRVYAFNGIFPAGNAYTSKADSLALQVGGGANLRLSRNFGIRMVEADYVRTLLPNGAANVQNDLRFAFGITYHVGHRPRS